MARKPDTPCASCGKLLYKSTTSLAAGLITCQPCRRARRGQTPPTDTCRDCCTPIEPRPWSRCEECAANRRRDVNRRKNYKRRGLTPARYTIKDIGESSAWRCHLCRKPVDASLSGMHPLGPTIDHLIPVSMGGTDEGHNVALAHRQCNTRRGVGGDVQLRLIS